MQLEAHLHVFAHQARQHRPHLAPPPVEIEHARLQHLLAAESQQLLGQPRGALSGLVDLFEMSRSGSPALSCQRQLAVAVDDGQQVIEIVRHASRQAAHRLHLLGLGETELQLGLFLVRTLLFREVHADARHADNLSAKMVPDRRVIPLHQAPLARPGNDLVLVVSRKLMRVHDLEEHPVNFFVYFGRDENLAPVAAQYLLAFPASEREQIIVAERDIRLPVQHDANQRNRLQYGAQPALALLHRILRPLAFGDVHVRSHQPKGAAIGIARHTLAAAQNPAPLAVLGFHAKLNFKRSAASLNAVRVHPHGVLAVVGMNQVLPRLALQMKIAGLVAQHATVARTVIRPVSPDVPVPQAVAGGLHAELEPLLTLAQRRLRPLAFA